MDLFKLMGTIAINNSDANSAIEESTGKVSSFGEKLSSGITTVAKWSAAVVAAATAAGTAVVKFAASAASTADNVDKMSQKIGISREAYQELDFICSQSGTSVDNLQTGLKTLTNQMQSAADGTESAAEMFDKLGLSIYDSSGELKDQETMMWETMSALQNMENQTEKAALAVDLFGRSGTELMPLLNGATGSIEEMKDMAHDLGLVLDDELIDSGVELTDTMDQMKRAVSAVYTKFAAKLMPIVKEVCQYVIDNLSPALEWLAEKFDNLKSWLSDIGEYAASSFQPVLDDLKEAFESVKEAVQPVIDKLKEYFTSGEAGEDISNRIKDAIDWLSGAYQTAKEAIGNMIDKLPEYVTSGELVEDITNAIKDAVEWLKEKFDAVKEALQPYIDKMTEYVTSGELVEDITNAIKDAVEVLSGVFSAIKEVLQPYIDTISDYVSEGELAEDVTDAIKEAVEWLSEKFTAVKDALQPYIDALSDYVESGELANDVADGLKVVMETLETVIEGVVDGVTKFSDWCSEHTGTLETIAIIVGSIATAIGIYNVAVTLANVVNTVYTTVTTAAAAATSALATAVSVLTSPITIIIAIIAAVIAVGVLLYKNWDTIKAKVAELASKISEKFTEIKEGIQEKINAAKEKVSEIFTNIYNTIHDKITAAKTTVTNIFDSIKDSISEKINAAKEKVSSAIDAIKGFFNFEFKWPNISLPHFSISPSGWKIGDLLKGTIPKLSIDWYAKAMDDPMLMESPTPFGVNKNGQIMAGGEAGSEVVSGTAKLMEMIAQAVASQNAALIAVLELILSEIRKNNSELADSLREAMEGMSFRIQNREFARLVKAVT